MPPFRLNAMRPYKQPQCDNKYGAPKLDRTPPLTKSLPRQGSAVYQFRHWHGGLLLPANEDDKYQRLSGFSLFRQVLSFFLGTASCLAPAVAAC